MNKTKRIDRILIHNSGPKEQRDRIKIIRKYDELIKYTGIKRLPSRDIAKLSNTQFYHLCEDAFNALDDKNKLKYANAIGLHRQNPLAYKWWYIDFINITGISGIRWLVFLIKSPYLYRKFIKVKNSC